VTQPRAVTCPSCGGSIEIRAAGYTVTLGCRYCGSVLDVAHEDVRLIKAYRRAVKNFAIAPGARGTLFDVEWEVIGALRRRSAESGDWQEFLLFNPYSGYRWLVLAGGEWQFGTMLLDRPENGPRSVSWRGGDYVRGDSETATTVTVLGEFYWKIARGDEARATAYTRGAEVLSCESTADETNWTQLIPLDDSAVSAAFAVERKFVGAPQRRARRNDTDDLPMMFLFALIALLAVGLVQELVSRPRVCTESTSEIIVGAPSFTTRIGTLEVRRAYQFVTISAISSNINNRWIDLDYSLVNRQTQQSIDAYGLIEYYTGTDSDGPWTEGSTSAETLIASVPRGTYDIYLDGGAHGWPNDPSVTVKQVKPDEWTVQTSADAENPWAPPEKVTVWFTACTGGFSWGMFWLIGFLLFAVPGAMLWWRHREDD